MIKIISHKEIMKKSDEEKEGDPSPIFWQRAEFCLQRTSFHVPTG